MSRNGFARSSRLNLASASCLSDRTHDVGPRSPGEEVAQVDELAMTLILDVDHTPAVLSTSDRFAIDDDASLRTDDSEGEHLLYISWILPLGTLP